MGLPLLLLPIPAHRANCSLAFIAQILFQPFQLRTSSPQTFSKTTPLTTR
jgi:hypothetical protein